MATATPLSHPGPLSRLLATDAAVCVWLHRRAWRWLRRASTQASRLADGPAWILIASILLAALGLGALVTVGRMVLGAAIGILLYKLLKRRTARPRPCDVRPGIHSWLPAPDRFSFPSGHTLHAVAMTTLACDALPLLIPVLVPFAALVGVSRVVLGLHYPSDVLAGAGIGAALAATLMWVT